MADLGAIGASYAVGSLSALGRPPMVSPYLGPARSPTNMPGWRVQYATQFYGGPQSQPGTPLWYGPPRTIGTDPMALYGVGGTVKQRLNGVDSPLVGCLVRLYARRSGTIAGTAISGVDGSFQIDNLLPDIAGFFAIAFDPEGDPVQNAVIFDRLKALPLVPGEIKDLEISFSTASQASYRLSTVYIEGVVTYAVTSGALPDGIVLNTSTGAITGKALSGGAYSFTVTAVGSVYGSGFRTWSGEVSEGLEYLNTLQGTSGLTLVRSGQADEGYIVLPALPFDFNLFGTNYKNNIYVCANSFITFGFGVSVYSGLSATNPGRGLLLAAADRSWSVLYAGSVLSGQGFLVRFDGSTSYTSYDGGNLWEVTFYVDGTIGLVTGNFPSGGVTNISDGTSWRSEGPAPVFQPNKAYLGTPTGTNGNYVWQENP
ncbi:fibronectin type III domain protein [Xanthomonas phage vB_Xar_IVIA-DoCa6]|uniref:Fibronectin type III domain protein n=1 Tax=Xanthomonas phage vB_Xar_IVIA-DoCa6 TaxID=2975533 RepID=A0A9X9JQP8_9CAUD|nr:fibronectin type III domain protein [Xanthomonas phage vB_Xar_IVIA-DoCa6]UYA98786.1 fibronectin type III domain protein [Xanthomonas phage vB_Xar_IVIA-DoCa6]